MIVIQKTKLANDIVHTEHGLIRNVKQTMPEEGY